MVEKNPYEDPKNKGVPLPGHEVDFFNWGEEQFRKELNTLPPAEKKKRLDAKKELAKRMQSEEF